MTYYMGDYYQGDYYQGDPGFFSFIGKAIKGLAGSFLGGGGGGAMAGPAAGGSLVKMAPQLGRVGRLATKIRGGMQKIGPIAIGAGAAGIGAAGAAGYAIGRRGRAAVPGMRRHRRMNVCNPKALRRAIRRTHGFSKLAMRTIHLVHPKKKVRFGGFKKRRRKA